MADAIRTLHLNTERTFRGGERQVLLLMRGLIERGHPAELVAQPNGELARRAEAAGVPVHRIRMRGELDPLALALLCSRLRQSGPDILHMHTGHAHTLGAAASMLSGIGRRVVSRRVVSRVGGHGLSRLKYRHGIDAYVAISQAVKAELVRAGVKPERVSVVHSCVDVGELETAGGGAGELRRAFGIPEGAAVVGSVGALCPPKGFSHFLDAIPRVQAAVGDVRFVLVGDGELRAELERQAAEAGLGPDALTFAGWRSDVPDWLALFDVFVSSSVLEGLGTSVLQAMAMETPVVVTTAGGLPEIVEDGENGLLAPPADAAALADGIIRLLNDAGLRARMAAAGRRTVAERFTPDRMVEGTLAVYADVRAGRRAATDAQRSDPERAE